MIKRAIKYLAAGISGIIILLLSVLFMPPLWRHFFTYPLLEKEIKELESLRKTTETVTGLNTYRGIIHAHSFWSHDSEGTLYDLIPAAKYAGIDFIFLTDHPRGNIDTIPRGYNGYYEGVLINAGSEKQGFVTWPRDTTVIDWNEDKDTISKRIVTDGGLIFYSHTEEDHNWSNRWYQGMEIYNFHTDTKDESLPPQIFNFIINGKKYRPWALRQMFDEQVNILALWDSLNTVRKIVGFSAADTHENQNIRARFLDEGRVEWVGPNANIIDTMTVKFWNKWLLGEPDNNGWVFKWMIDTYSEGFSYITNYVLADTLSVPSLTRHMKAGHLYTAFKSLGDASGFMYYSKDQNDSIYGILGDSITLEQVKSLNAVSPLPGQFRLIHDGKTISITEEDSYQYAWSEVLEKGAYRIEMHIKLRGKYVPWLYSNPIYIN